MSKLPMPKKGKSSPKTRLNRVAGQINGVVRMMDEGRSEDQILSQLQAAISSLEALKLEMIKSQVRREMIDSLDNSLEALKAKL